MTISSEFQNLEIRNIVERTSPRTEKKADCWQPAIELTESEGYFQLKAALPGIDAKNIVAIASPTAVVIKGNCGSPECDENHQNRTVCHSEFHYGNFERTVNLPTPVENELAQAEYIHGVLILTLPKMNEEEGRELPL